MTPDQSVTVELPQPNGYLLPDTRGMNFYDADPTLADLLELYLPVDIYAHVQPYLRRMGRLVSGILDELAHTTDRNPPILHHRHRRGIDVQMLEKHPAYVELDCPTC